MLEVVGVVVQERVETTRSITVVKMFSKLAIQDAAYKSEHTPDHQSTTGAASPTSSLAAVEYEMEFGGRR